MTGCKISMLELSNAFSSLPELRKSWLIGIYIVLLYLKLAFKIVYIKWIYDLTKALMEISRHAFHSSPIWILFSCQLALANNDVPAAKQILLLGAGPEIIRSDGDTHLHLAVEVGDLELVMLLVKAGADCSVKYQGHSMADLARIKVAT